MPRILRVLIALALIAAAAVQWNDPDGALWIGIYGAAALVCLVGAFRPLPRAIPLGLAGLAALGLALTLPAALSSGEWNSEAPREAGGLALTLVCLLAVGLPRTSSSGK